MITYDEVIKPEEEYRRGWNKVLFYMEERENSERLGKKHAMFRPL